MRGPGSRPPVNGWVSTMRRSAGLRRMGRVAPENRGTPDIPPLLPNPIISNYLCRIFPSEPRPHRIFLPKYRRFCYGHPQAGSLKHGAFAGYHPFCHPLPSTGIPGFPAKLKIKWSPSRKPLARPGGWPQTGKRAPESWGCSGCPIYPTREQAESVRLESVLAHAQDSSDANALYMVQCE